MNMIIHNDRKYDIKDSMYNVFDVDFEETNRLQL